LNTLRVHVFLRDIDHNTFLCATRWVMNPSAKPAVVAKQITHVISGSIIQAGTPNATPRKIPSTRRDLKGNAGTLSSLNGGAVGGMNERNKLGIRSS
jgi:hypothetical protein